MAFMPRTPKAKDTVIRSTNRGSIHPITLMLAIVLLVVGVLTGDGALVAGNGNGNGNGRPEFVDVLVTYDQTPGNSEKNRIRDAITVDYPDARVNVVTQLALQRSPAEKLKAFVCNVSPMVRGDYGD